MTMSSGGVTGTPRPRAKTTCADAWLGGHYATMKLARDIEAVRVPVGAGIRAAAETTSERLGKGTGARGRWFAVGDVILTRTAYTDSRALPAGFSEVNWCVLKAGSVVNVGRCHPLFGHSGGGEQVELVMGEPVTVAGDRPDRTGRA